MTSSVDRVPAHTSAEANRAIQATTERSIAYFREHPDEIPQRMNALDREWDIERALAAGSTCLSLLGLAQGLAGRRRWFVLPAVVQGFYLQHTLQGWCPPLPVLRALGFRTPAEIEEERCSPAMLLDAEPAADAEAANFGRDASPASPLPG